MPAMEEPVARTLTIIVPADRSGSVVQALGREPAVIALSLQRSEGLKPVGDIVTLHTTNDGAASTLRMLEQGGELDRCLVILDEPAAIIAAERQGAIDAETNEAVWEETAALLRRDTNVGFNYLTLMATSGIIAALGLLTDTLHLVVGAMLLAPGFEPLMRVVLGGLQRGQGTNAASGLKSVVAGYALLAVGAAAGTVLAMGTGLWQGSTSSLYWLNYWTRTDLTAPLVAIPAAIAGVAVIASRRTTFAAGVMVALALVPGMAILGIGLTLGEGHMALLGLARWAADAASVLVAGLVALGAKRAILHRRRARD